MRKAQENPLNGLDPPSSPPKFTLLIIKKIMQITARTEKTITLNPSDSAGT